MGVRTEDYLRARYRLMLVTTRVGIDYSRTGTYLARIEASRLPPDPFSPRNRLRYQRTESGFRVWSVGPTLPSGSDQLPGLTVERELREPR